jgi:hypothetical protein
MSSPLPIRPLLAVLALLLSLCLCMGVAEAKQPVNGSLRPAVHHNVRLGAPSAVPCQRAQRQRLKLQRLMHIARRRGSQGLFRRARRNRAGASASRACAAPSEPQTSSASPGSIYWGAWMGSQLTGEEAPWDMKAVSKFEQMAGKGVSIVHFGSPFANCTSQCYFYDFPTEPMENIREHGSIPFLSWSSQSLPTRTEEPEYQLSDVANGDYDSYIREYAEDAASWGHPFFLRFDWEMNGNWFPWSVGANGNSAADYVAAWRHVHNIFTSVGATNATWVWCPNVDPGKNLADLASLYPGDEYVDWTCLDGYNWGTSSKSPNHWADFDQLYRGTYNEIVETIAPSKPMIIGETAASESGGSKSEWISEMLNKIPTEYPRIKGVLWFEKYDDGMDWPIETSSSATSAFASGIQQPAYATNTFADLGGSGPIAPPGT